LFLIGLFLKKSSPLKPLGQMNLNMLPTMFQFIWPSGFRGEHFYKSANQKQELLMVAMFVNGSGQNEQSF
jgi:hypothetical protein